MKDQLKQYIDSVFASAADTEKNRELKEEIFADLCDKYDAHLAEGAEPHEAYRRTVAGVGDLSALIGGLERAEAPRNEKKDGNSGSYRYDADKASADAKVRSDRVQLEPDENRRSFELIRSLMLAFAIALYILSPVPAITIGASWSAAFLFIMVALATGMIIAMPIFRIHTVSAEVSEGDRRKLLFDYRMAKLMMAGAVMGYILCVCPAIISQNDAIGATGLFLLIALSTAAIIVRRSIYKEGLEKIAVEEEPDELFGHRSDTRKKSKKDGKKEKREKTLGDKIMSVITGIYWLAVTAAYICVGIYTGRWAAGVIIFVLAGFLIGMVHGVYSLVVGKGTAGPIVKIVICSVLLFSLIHTAQWLLGVDGDTVSFKLSDIGFFNFNTYNDDRYEYGNNEFSGIESLDSLSISWEQGNVKVSVWDGDTVVIREVMTVGGVAVEDRGEQLRYMLSNKELDIREYSPRFIIFGSLGPAKDLEVLLPKSLGVDEVKITAVSAPVEITGVEVSKLDVDTVSGGLGVTGCDADVMDMTGVSGKVTVKDSTAEDIDVDTVSCAIVLSVGGALESINVDGVSADVDVYLPRDIEGFDVEFDGVSGSFRSEFEPMKLMTVYGNGEVDIEVDTVSGDLTVKPQTE